MSTFLGFYNEEGFFFNAQIIYEGDVPKEVILDAPKQAKYLVVKDPHTSENQSVFFQGNTYVRVGESLKFGEIGDIYVVETIESKKDNNFTITLKENIER